MSDTTAYATTQDVANLWRPLTDAEISRADYLLAAASDTLRQTAKNRGYDLDTMVEDGDVYESVLADIVVAAVTRVLRTPVNSEPVSQFSQSALGYTVSGTYLNPQGGIFFFDNELARIGIKKPQKLGRIELYDTGDTDSDT